MWKQEQFKSRKTQKRTLFFQGFSEENTVIAHEVLI